MNANKTPAHGLTRELGWILGFIALIWVIFALDRFLPLEQFGLIPRDFSGLLGIAGMHFLHGNWGHLLSNSIPLLVLLMLLAGSRANSLSIVILISLIGGLILWFIGRSSLHIGASLLVFGLASFIIVSGLIEKRPLPLMISIIVIVIYGSSLFKGILPIQRGVSFEGHISGLIAGALCAFVLLPKNKRKQSL